jgi:hypothetical protein
MRTIGSKQVVWWDLRAWIGAAVTGETTNRAQSFGDGYGFGLLVLLRPLQAKER